MCFLPAQWNRLNLMGDYDLGIPAKHYPSPSLKDFYLKSDWCWLLMIADTMNKQIPASILPAGSSQQFWMRTENGNFIEVFPTANGLRLPVAGSGLNPSANSCQDPTSIETNSMQIYQNESQLNDQNNQNSSNLNDQISFKQNESSISNDLSIYKLNDQTKSRQNEPTTLQLADQISSPINSTSKGKKRKARRQILTEEDKEGFWKILALSL